MKQLLKLSFIIIVLFALNVKADTTYIRGNIAPDTTKVWVRSCASDNCGCIKSDTGTDVKISYPEMFEIIGEEGNFYKIRLLFNGFTFEGYISKGNSTKSFVQSQKYTVKDETITYYINQGFDKTYATKLAILKTIHPNWTFTKYQVNATFDEVIKGETKYISTNLIDSANTYLRSTEDGSYVDGNWVSFGSGWYAASTQTVKFFVDPRNFLLDGHVFMFESLVFDEKMHTESLAEGMLKGTFMEGMTFKYNANNEKEDVSYAKCFVDSGKTNGVSVVHLASRAIQEQGANGSILSSGTSTSYPGYYNFFNVGASGKTDSEIINNGLAYAKKHEWNSPYASIVGGGSILNNYVTEYGQINLYLEKFDFAGSTYYSTQYMQNVKAPYSESYTAYKTYVKNNLLDSAFTFAIPVFKGTMPSATSLEKSYNEDATLSSLNISGCNLMPSFTSSATNYTCNVNDNVTSVVVNAVATSNSSKVTGNGQVNLMQDSTDIKVTVTSAAGTTKTYKVTVTKVSEENFSPDDILSKLSININNNYISGLDYQSDSTYLVNLIKNNYKSATVDIPANKKLSTGMNIKITNGTTKEYTIIIYGDNNGDSVIDILDLLKCQKDILGVNKLNGAYKMASDVNKDGVIDILDLLKIQKQILGVSQISQ